MTNPVRIRGVDYPSQVAAARALGVHPTTLQQALCRGKQDGVGLGLRPAGGRPGNPVTIRGVWYPSQQAAATALGVTREAITLAIRRGALDRVGLGGARSGRPVSIGGRLYPSYGRAAAALGVARSTINLWASKAVKGKPYRHPIHGPVRVS